MSFENELSKMGKGKPRETKPSWTHGLRVPLDILLLAKRQGLT
jgi:hypothetical protein